MSETQTPSEQWWRQRWQRYVLEETLGLQPAPSRLNRARSARVRLTTRRGRITAEVQSVPYGRPYRATFRVRSLSRRDWRRVLQAVADRPEAAHGLLAGAPGPELEEAFAAAGAALFPVPDRARAGLPVHCTCRGYPGCSHVLALAVHGADLLATNPFLWLETLGQSRTDFLAALRAQLADQQSPTGGSGVTGPDASPSDTDAGPPPLDPDRFWEMDEQPEAIAAWPAETAAPDALLRALGEIPLPREARTVERLVEREVGWGGVALRVTDQVAEPLESLLRDYAAHIGQTAARIARGERPPIHREEPLPGRPLPLRKRLLTEIQEALARAGRPLSVETLSHTCPTAAALREETSTAALRDALGALPPEITVLAGRYVGYRPAFLRGASFRHVITFDEWYRRELLPDTDWVRALSAVGLHPPYTLRTEPPGPLFERLQPEVGDELLLTVTDPTAPVLEAAIRRRASRDLAPPADANQRAADAILRHLAATGADTLSEEEAVAVLLGEGLYRQTPGPDPVWLLAAAEQEGLFAAGASRHVTPSAHRAWRPRLGRPQAAHHFREGDRLLREFPARLDARGVSPTRQELALSVIQAWHRFWRGPHHLPKKAPSIAALLFFLMNVAPMDASRTPAAAELAPVFLAEWFRYVSEAHPAMEEVYRPHLAACGLTDAYAYRLQTLPDREEGEESLRAWQLEGLRWMGPWRYLA